MFSSEFRDHLKSLMIDEERRHVLTKIRKTKTGVVKKESDHNVLITKGYFCLKEIINIFLFRARSRYIPSFWVKYDLDWHLFCFHSGAIFWKKWSVWG